MVAKSGRNQHRSHGAGAANAVSPVAPAAAAGYTYVMNPKGAGPKEKGAACRRAAAVYPLIAAALLLAGLCGAGVAAVSVTAAKQGGNYPPYPAPDYNKGHAPPDEIKRGEYLVVLGDCIACHTDGANGGAAFAGGLKIDTPFGALYTPNITPDKETGIGDWSDGDFVRAVREGVAPDGSYFFPVFPYDHFNKMSRDEVLAIKAYLFAIPAAHRANKADAIAWPFSMRFLQFGWRLLYFDFSEKGFAPHENESAVWNRGAFIVEGPGHCSLCHTELNFLGHPKQAYYLAGAFVDDYYAPDISAKGLRNLPNQKVAEVFRKDELLRGGALKGPMADTEHDSLRRMTPEDQLAVAEYLKTVISEVPFRETVSAADLAPDAGKKLYQSTCIACHGTGAAGAPKVGDKQAWAILADQGKAALYDVAIHGSGMMPHKGMCGSCSDARIEAAVDYMLSQSQ